MNDNYNIIIRNYTDEEISLNELYDYLKEWDIEKLKVGVILYYSTSSEYSHFDLRVSAIKEPDFDKGYVILEAIEGNRLYSL